MGTNGKAVESAYQRVMLELARCGFAPLGDSSTQGSGLIGRALSADGTTWADVAIPRSDLRASLRHLLRTGELRGTGRSTRFATKISFTTLFNDGSSLVTGGEGALAELALRHMQRLDARLLQRHPLKALIHVDAPEVEAAAQRLRSRPAQPSGRPLTVPQLRQLGVPAHLAKLIGGACANTATVPQALP
jgi:hypothetical protein